MKEEVVYRLTRKQQVIGILIVCLFFVCITTVCLKRQRETYRYAFDLSNLEIKGGMVQDGIIRSDETSDDYVFATRPFILPAGGYTISISYMSSAESSVLVQGNNDCVFDIFLPATYGEWQTITDNRLILPGGTDRGKLKFYQNSEGELNVAEIRLDSPVHIYRDYYVIIALSGLATAGIIAILIFFNRFKLTRTSCSYIGLFILANIAVNIPFMVRGTYYEIDTQAHMKRIEAIAQGIRDGQFPVIIGPNYANQYGELVALQPGLFLYIPALLRLCNVSMPLAYNLYMIMVNLATSVAALLCAERMFTTIRWGMIAAVYYLIEPFRLFVMMGLGAGAGMGTALVFLPFLVVGLHEAVNKGGFRWKYIAFGLWGIVCSHVMGFALAMILIFIYVLTHIKRVLQKDVFISLLKAAVVFAVMSAGVLLPFVSFYFTQWNRNALAWTDFYHYPVEPERELQNIIALAVMAIAYWGVRKSGSLTKFGRGIFAVGFVSVLMALPVFPWSLLGRIGIVDSFLSMMQYPLRFHFLAVPYVAYVAAESVCSNMDSRTKIRRKILYSITGILAVGVAVCYYNFYKADKLFEDSLSGEINTLMEDYLPEGTLTEWYATDTGDFSDYDLVQAYSYVKSYTHIDCTYSSAAPEQYMEFPIFYYDGYVARDQNGNRLKTERGERNRVRVYLTESDEIQELHLKYEVKRVYTVIFLVSLIMGMIWIAFKTAALGYRAVKSQRITR